MSDGNCDSANCVKSSSADDGVLPNQPSISLSGLLRISLSATISWGVGREVPDSQRLTFFWAYWSEMLRPVVSSATFNPSSFCVRDSMFRASRSLFESLIRSHPKQYYDIPTAVSYTHLT